MRLHDSEWTDANFVAGALCLNFSNTLSGRQQKRLKDRLTDLPALLDWFATAELMSASKNERLARDDAQRRTDLFADAIELRETIFCIFEAVRSGGEPVQAALNTLNRFVGEAVALREIKSVDDRFVWRWKQGASPYRTAIGQIALSAAELLTSDNRLLVKKCRAESCAWLFVDETKNRSRIWCDMAVCGNRAKARRHSRSNGS